jgi:prepilin-type N-terminal cleavage/methylation domain-containing protein
MRRGFTLMEIMIVLAIIALLVGISVPGFLRARLTANESAARANLQTISVAMANYHTTSGGAYTGATLNGLATATPPYFDTVLGCAAPPCAKSGYQFAEIAVDTAQTYFIWAEPVNANITGISTFCVTDDGVVRRDPAGADIANRAACLALTPAE